MFIDLVKNDLLKQGERDPAFARPDLLPLTIMPNFTPEDDHYQVLVRDTESTWAQAYCRWMGAPMPPVPSRWRTLSRSQLKQWINKQ